MAMKLNQFLNEHKVKGNVPFTHTSRDPQHKYYIDEDDILTFWEYYQEAVANGYQHSLTEAPETFSPLRVDVDFKIDPESGTSRKYTDGQLEEFIEKYQEEIQKLVPATDFDNSMLTCIVLEKKAPRNEGGVIKDGFHLHFPNFITENWVFEFLRERVSSWMTRSKLWEDKKVKYLDDDFVDSGIGKKLWLLYGSAKKKNPREAQPYLLTRIYDHALSELDIIDVFEEQLLNMSNDDIDEVEYLPRLLSITGYVQGTPIKPEAEHKKLVFGQRSKKKRRNIPLNKNKRTEHTILEDIQEIKNAGLMDMINARRAETYNEWIDIGYILYNIGEGHEECLNMWIDFSQKSEKYEPGECEKLWSKMYCKNWTKASLHYLAKLDDPDRYIEWRNFGLRQLIEECIKDSADYNMMMVVKKMYGKQFVCADKKKGVWYEFKNHRYNEVNGASCIEEKLPTEIAQLFKDTAKKYIAEQSDVRMQMTEEGVQSDARFDELEKKINRCHKIISELKTQAYVNKVVAMCSTHMRDDKFIQKKDENKMLIGCENGVLDLESKIFREGRPDDYITYSTNREYEEMAWDDDRVVDFIDYLEKVFPNKNIRDYFCDTLAIALRGGNINKRFYVNTGDGNNSKSIIFNILEEAVGDYVCDLPKENILLKSFQGGSGPKPEMARVRGKRFLLVKEIGKKEKVDVAEVKKMTGNDTFFARSLQEKGGDIKPMFTLFVQCNELFEIPNSDNAMFNRVRLIEYESTFDYDAPKSEAEQKKRNHYPADNEFDMKIPDLAQVMLWFLFDRFCKLPTLRIKEPGEVTVASQKYKAKCDVFSQFKDQCIEKIENKDDALEVSCTLSELYKLFIEWYRENYPSYAKDIINKYSFRGELNKRLGVIKNTKRIPQKGDQYGLGVKDKYYGYRIAAADDEIDFE